MWENNWFILNIIISIRLYLKQFNCVQPNESCWLELFVFDSSTWTHLNICKQTIDNVGEILTGDFVVCWREGSLFVFSEEDGCNICVFTLCRFPAKFC